MAPIKLATREDSSRVALLFFTFEVVNHTNQLVEIRPVVKLYQPTANIIKRLQIVVNGTSQKSAIYQRNNLLYGSLNICGIVLYHWLIVRVGHKR